MEVPGQLWSPVAATDDGNVHFGDTIPPEYADQMDGQSGGAGADSASKQEPVVTESVAGEEIERRKEAARRAEADRVLLRTYLSVEEIEDVRDRRIDQLESQNSVTERYLGRLNQQLADLELAAAEHEGAKLAYLAAPQRIIGDAEGRVRGIEVVRTRPGEFDESGRRRPVPTGEVMRIDCDTVILAVGERVDPDFANASGLRLNDDEETLEVDRYSLETSRDRFYAGGDLITGASNVSNAMGIGKKAARNKRYADHADDDGEYLERAESLPEPRVAARSGGGSAREATQRSSPRSPRPFPSPRRFADCSPPASCREPG